MYLSDCCGAEATDAAMLDVGICPDCHEHCEFTKEEEKVEGLDALIEALTIARKYGNIDCPTHCEHDVLHLMLDPSKVSQEDKDRLEELYFRPEDCYFISGYFGSA